VVTANTASAQYIAGSEDVFLPIPINSSNASIFFDFKIYYTNSGEEIITGSPLPPENEKVTIDMHGTYLWIIV